MEEPSTETRIEAFRFDEGRPRGRRLRIGIALAALLAAAVAYRALTHVEARPEASFATGGRRRPQTVPPGGIPVLPGPRKPPAEAPSLPVPAPSPAIPPSQSQGFAVGEGLDFPFYDGGRRVFLLKARTCAVDEKQDACALQWVDLEFYDVDFRLADGSSGRPPAAPRPPEGEGPKRTLSLSAREGRFTRKDHRATLEKDVEVRDDADGILHTDRLEADLKARLLSTDAPIDLLRSGMAVRGTGMRIAGKEGTLEILRDVTMAFEQEGTAGPDVPEEVSRVRSLRASSEGPASGGAPPGAPPALTLLRDKEKAQARFHRLVRLQILQAGDERPIHLTADDLTLHFARTAAAPEGKSGGLKLLRIEAREGPDQPVVLKTGAQEIAGGLLRWDAERESGTMVAGRGGEVAVRHGKNEVRGKQLSVVRKGEESIVTLEGPVVGTLWKPPTPDKAHGKAGPAGDAKEPAPAPGAVPADDPLAAYRAGLEGRLRCDKVQLWLAARGPNGKPRGAGDPAAPAPRGGDPPKDDGRLTRALASGDVRIDLGDARIRGAEIAYDGPSRTLTLRDAARRASLEDPSSLVEGKEIRYELDEGRLKIQGAAHARFRSAKGPEKAGRMVRLMPGETPFEVNAATLAAVRDPAGGLARVEGEGGVILRAQGMLGKGARIRWDAEARTLDLEGGPVTLEGREGSVQARSLRYDEGTNLVLLEGGVRLTVLDASRSAASLGMDRIPGGGDRVGEIGVVKLGCDHLEVEFEDRPDAASVGTPFGRMRRALALRKVRIENVRLTAKGDSLDWEAKAGEATLSGEDAEIEFHGDPPVTHATKRFTVETPKGEPVPPEGGAPPGGMAAPNGTGKS